MGWFGPQGGSQDNAGKALLPLRIRGRASRGAQGNPGRGRVLGAGPTGNRYGDKSGHACIAVAGPVERVITVETGDADREANMWAFTRAALKLFEECLAASPPKT